MQESAKLPTTWGEFDMRGIRAPDDSKEHVLLSHGNISDGNPVLMRIHSECLTGDAFSSLRCDCGPQLEASMKLIIERGAGMIIYLRQEGRGIGLFNKIRAYALQDKGQDTVEANESLGFGADERNYSVVPQVLKELSIDSVRLMTNNPRKVNALSDAGVNIIERVPMIYGVNPKNENYLSVKKGKLGHMR
ncbi:MAG: GTP cyclohydrolase II [Pseudomonadota bacterium]